MFAAPQHSRQDGSTVKLCFQLHWDGSMDPHCTQHQHMHLPAPGVHPQQARCRMSAKGLSGLLACAPVPVGARARSRSCGMATPAYPTGCSASALSQWRVPCMYSTSFLTHVCYTDQHVAAYMYNACCKQPCQAALCKVQPTKTATSTRLTAALAFNLLIASRLDGCSC